MLVVEEIIGIEEVVADVVVSSAVELIGSAFCDDTYDPTGIAAIFGTVAVLENSELGDRVGIWIGDHSVTEQIVIEAAIEQVRDGIGARSADAVVTGSTVNPGFVALTPGWVPNRSSVLRPLSGSS